MKSHYQGIIIVIASWVVSTLLLLTSYGLIQQSYRMGANDPQIQLAEDGAAALATGDPADTIVGDSDINLRTSLAPAVIVYGDDKQVVVTDGKIDGKAPVIPDGVLEYAKLHGRNMVTWEPTSGVRLAAVVVRSGGETPGYVVAARSVREVEVRESAALNVTALVWVILTLIIFGAWALILAGHKRIHRAHHTG